MASYGGYTGMGVFVATLYYSRMYVQNSEVKVEFEVDQNDFVYCGLTGYSWDSGNTAIMNDNVTANLSYFVPNVSLFSGIGATSGVIWGWYTLMNCKIYYYLNLTKSISRIEQNGIVPYS